MKLSRRLRLFAAVLALAAFAVGQAGLAAHACMADPAMAAAMAAGEGGHDCCGDDLEPQPALCDAHCQQGDQSRDQPAPPALAAIAAAQAWRPAVAAVAAPPPAPGEQRSLLARAAAPPLVVRHCRFLI